MNKIYGISQYSNKVIDGVKRGNTFILYNMLEKNRAINMVGIKEKFSSIDMIDRIKHDPNSIQTPEHIRIVYE